MAVSMVAVTAGIALLTTAAVAAKPSAGDQLATMLIRLEHPGGLKKFVRQVSDPTSPKYRQYRSVSYLAKRFGATTKKQKAALSWLAARGISGEVGPTGSWITASVEPGAIPDRLLGDSRQRRTTLREGVEAQVPPGLGGIADSVSVLGSQPGAYGPAALTVPPTPPSSGRPNTGTPSGCAEGVGTGYGRPGFTDAYDSFTPNQYLTAYGHSRLQSQGLSGKGVRVALIEVDGYLPGDIETFASCFGVDVPPIRDHLIGLTAPPPIQGETILDLEVLSAAAPGLDGIDLYTNPGSAEGLFLAAAAAIAAKSEPDVISVSLEGCEAGYQGQVTFLRALDNTFEVAAGAGISTLVASGDQGSSMCERSPIGALPLGAASNPATSPWVTAVGGTNLVLDSANRITDQVTWNNAPDAFAAGGSGRSILESRPWYQRGALSRKKADGMRVVPDVAGLADVLPGYAIYCSAPTCPGAADWTPIGGTSAATPLLAGGIALLDQQAAKSKQGNLGFLNPLLYNVGTGKQSKRLFDDVTTGDTDLGLMIPPSAGGGEPIGCCTAGPGFDLATGFGSPYVDVLGKLAQGFAR